MATQSVDAELTKQVGFESIPVEGKHLFSVNPGLAPDVAVRRAQLLEMSARNALQDAVDGGMDGDDAENVRFLLQMADALRKSAGQEA